MIEAIFLLCWVAVLYVWFDHNKTKNSNKPKLKKPTGDREPDENWHHNEGWDLIDDNNPQIIPNELIKECWEARNPAVSPKTLILWNFIHGRKTEFVKELENIHPRNQYEISIGIPAQYTFPFAGQKELWQAFMRRILTEQGYKITGS